MTVMVRPAASFFTHCATTESLVMSVRRNRRSSAGRLFANAMTAAASAAVMRRRVRAVPLSSVMARG